MMRYDMTRDAILCTPISEDLAQETKKRKW